VLCRAPQGRRLSVVAVQTGGGGGTSAAVGSKCQKTPPKYDRLCGVGDRARSVGSFWSSNIGLWGEVLLYLLDRVAGFAHPQRPFTPSVEFDADNTVTKTLAKLSCLGESVSVCASPGCLGGRRSV
jgi:hypothetical protein